MMFGQYRLDELLGRGGMGDVHRAYDTVREREVALKILTNRPGDDGTFAQRFRRECQILARLGEPHIIPIHDYGDVNGTLFLDMRLVHGKNLRELTESGGPLAPQRAIAIAEQIAAALDAAHRAGIVHRDVKPENILVTPADFAYLIDFGIAVADDPAEHRLTRTGTAVGSAAYMAPEQFDGQQVTKAADTYALTAVVYELLTGTPAHRGASLSEVLKSVLVGPVTPASVVRPDLPPAVDAVLARGMNSAPEQRYAGPMDLIAALRGALLAAPTTVANPVPAPAPAPAAPSSATRVAPQSFYAEPPAPPTHVPATPAYAAPSHPSPAPAAPSRPRTGMWIGVGAAVLVVAALIAAVAFLMGDRGNGDGGETAAPSASTETHTQTATVTQQPTTVTQQPTVTQQAPAPKSGVNYGVGLNTKLRCAAGPASAVFTGYETTTCPFATNVAVELMGRNPQAGSVLIYADSPQAGDALPMNCRLAHDSDRNPLWKCSGGASGNAVVYVYP